MNVARRADGPLSAKHTLALVQLLQAHADGRAEQLILADLAALYPVSWSRAHNTIALLMKFNVLTEVSTRLMIKDPAIGIGGWSEPIAKLVAEEFALRAVNSGTNCLQANGTQEGLWIDSMLLPGSADGLPFWIIEFGIAERESTRSRFWRVTKSYERLFLAATREANRRQVRRAMTAAQLESKLGDDAAHGREAEEWVVGFEQQRLARHPLVDQVRRISDENVSAGFDIVSFSEPGVLHHDLFIEVKSYIGSKRFFWSRNEISSARTLGEKYCLYLIDRDQTNIVGYLPQMIRGPYSALMLSADTGWSISPTTFECVPDSA